MKVVLPRLGSRRHRSTGPASSLARFDLRVDRWFEVLRDRSVADGLFYGASALGDHGLIWVFLAALRGLRSEHDWHAAVRTATALAGETVLVNAGIKSLFQRTRPFVDTPHPRRLRQPRTSSFPSGHATSAFMAATLLSEDDPLWPLYYATAVVVASSRVHVRIHHASDVVGGTVIGLVMGRLIRHLAPLPIRPVRPFGNA